MVQSKNSNNSKSKSSGRCWPGYEPVKGKRKNQQGSCRKKAESNMTGSEKEFVKKRQKQIHSGDRGKSGPPDDPKKVKAKARQERRRGSSGSSGSRNKSGSSRS